ncbi:MAG TPA: hypothetical protein VHU86_05525 [Solirubrobacterales bacterium]|nr:hypothetical protein [Solirubrobacterales bacterium]
MSAKRKRPDGVKRSGRLTLTTLGGSVLAVGVLLAAVAAIAHLDSTFIWVDVALCLVLAAILLLLGIKSCEPGCWSSPIHVRDSDDPNRWRNTALVLAALIAIFSPVVKVAVGVGTTVFGPVATGESECKAVGPGGEAQSS